MVAIGHLEKKNCRCFGLFCINCLLLDVVAITPKYVYIKLGSLVQIPWSDQGETWSDPFNIYLSNEAFTFIVFETFKKVV